MGTKRNREEFDNSSLFSYSIRSIYPSEEGQPQWLTYIMSSSDNVYFPINFSQTPFSTVSSGSYKYDNSTYLSRMPYNITYQGFSRSKASSDIPVYVLSIGL